MQKLVVYIWPELQICNLQIRQVFWNTPSGQSYTHFTLANYDSRVIINRKLLIFMTLES